MDKVFKPNPFLEVLEQYKCSAERKKQRNKETATHFGLQTQMHLRTEAAVMAETGPPTCVFWCHWRVRLHHHSPCPRTFCAVCCSGVLLPRQRSAPSLLPVCSGTLRTRNLWQSRFTVNELGFGERLPLTMDSLPSCIRLWNLSSLLCPSTIQPLPPPQGFQRTCTQ